MSQVDTLVLTEASNLVARIGDPMSGSAVFRGAWEAMSGHSERSPATRLNDLDQQAATIKGQWARAALDLVDGRRQVSSYRQLRDDALAQLEAIEVGRRPRDGELPDAVQLLEMASALRATFGGDDSRAQGQGLALLVERVVPRRRRRNEYAVEIQWTPLAEAIRRCAEACGGAEPLIDAAPRVHEADHSDPGYSTT